MARSEMSLDSRLVCRSSHDLPSIDVTLRGCLACLPYETLYVFGPKTYEAVEVSAFTVE